MSDQPELPKLVDALEELSPQEVRYMCTKLGVDQYTLDKIDADHRDALTRIPKYLQAWLDRDSHPSWAKIAEQLSQSKKLNKSTLSEKIMDQYCPLGRSVSPCLSQSSNASSSLDMHEDSFSSDLSSIDESECSSHKDGIHQGASDLEVASATEQATVLPSSDHKPNEHKLRCVSKTAYALTEQFRSVVISANVYLSEKELSRKELNRFKIDLTKLPMLKKYKKLRFLRKKKNRILRAETMQAIFNILDPYWNYVDYSLLEYIVNKYCNKKVRSQMKKYKLKLEEFERATSVLDFTSARPDHRRFPTKHATLKATVQVNPAACSLHDARKIKESIAEKASLEPYVALLRGLNVSSVVLTIAFPHAARKYVEQALDDEFLKQLNILPESVLYSDTQPVSIPRKIHTKGLSTPDESPPIAHKKLHAEAPEDIRGLSTPDESSPIVHTKLHAKAPQDIREELSYTIKRRDLKPIYRNSGPQLVRKYCEEIEAKTRSAKINIHMEWKPDEVHFDIAGLQEGVTRAMHFIRKEFLPKEKAQKMRSDSEKYKAAPFSVDQQRDIKSFSQRTPILLTKEALREHERLTTPKELRQFACRPCESVWWRVVLSIKAVSRCNGCKVRYDALPREKEYGIGRFVCPNDKCGNVFYGRCHADSKWKCHKCETIVSKPYIHPSNKQPYRTKSGFRPHYCDEFDGHRKCPLLNKVLYASTRHVSTGSTIDTWLSQTDGYGEFPFYMPLYGSNVSPSQLSPIRERSTDEASCTSTGSYKSSRSSRSAHSSRSSRD